MALGYRSDAPGAFPSGGFFAWWWRGDRDEKVESVYVSMDSLLKGEVEAQVAIKSPIGEAFGLNPKSAQICE